MRRQGIAPPPAGAALRFLYEKKAGRGLLKLAASRPVSIMAGRFMDSPLSKPLIKPFARKNGIVLGDYLPVEYDCFNAFFCRPIRKNLRPIPDEAASFMAPCDGLLSAYRITDGLLLPIKQSSYTVSELLDSREEAARFRDGICLVFRLCVNHYHRYCYLDDGQKGANIFLPGMLHTVRPIALESVPVFVRNCREYTVMETEHFGTVTQVEVGALLVGRIDNRHSTGSIRRGEEKGRFLYGGSTIVVLLEKDRAIVDKSYFDVTANGTETPVVMGQILGRAKKMPNA